MKKLLPFLAAICLGAIIWACDDEGGEDEKESPVYIIADWYKKDSVIGGRHYFFKMEIQATQGTLEKLVMTAVDGYNGRRELETIELSGTKKKTEYDYLLPIFPDSVVEMELRATVTTSEGEEWNGSKKLKVFAADYTLTEQEFTLVEKPAPGKYNALRFSGGKPEAISTEDITDAAMQHLVIAYNKDQTDNVTSKGIRTYASNIRMARVNYFDYSNAKYNSVLNTFQDRYNVGEIYTSIGDLKAGDIILIGTINESTKKATALAAIKVSKVPETNDQTDDTYSFLVKGMAR